MLDIEYGLIRLDIRQSQHLEVTAVYRDFGFSKFSVYSDDYDNEVIIALANNHAVYEIDWKNTIEPKLINKYSLMENSKVNQVELNDEYLVVQSFAFASNETSPIF